MLSLASGIACAIALGALINTTGNVLSTRKPAQQAAKTREAWLDGLARGAALPLLKGNLQQVESDWDVFRPWLNWPRWQAVELPED